MLRTLSPDAVTQGWRWCVREWKRTSCDECLLSRGTEDNSVLADVGSCWERQIRDEECQGSTEDKPFVSCSREDSSGTETSRSWSLAEGVGSATVKGFVPCRVHKTMASG